MIPPAMRKDIPTVTVRRGELVRIHVAFAPRKAAALVIQNGRTATYKLRAARVLTWRPPRSGLVLVDAQVARGSATYVVRLRILKR
jgi:hypothetical protein